MTDGNGHATNWTYDDQNRMVAKTFADGTEVAYNYENTTSRLRSITDALNQVTTYTYNLDDSLKARAYLNAINPTPGVSFTYDPIFLRITHMTDGNGTTAYAYYPITNPPALGANLLKTVTGPNGDLVSFAYDALERPATRTVDGSVAQLGFDSIGRIITDKNALDTFNIAYLGGSALPLSLNSVSTKGFESLYGYFGSTGDDQLKTITNQFHNGTAITPISNFQYTYDTDDEVTSTAIQKQFATAITRATGYDAAGQLVSLTASASGGSNYHFAYDNGANRISETVGATTTSFTYNNVNEITAPGPAIYDKDGEPLTLGGKSFKWDAANRLISVSSGADITKFAYDGLNRRTRITQLSSGKTVSDKFYVWSGSTLWLETDSLNHNGITQRYLPEGVIQNARPFYYAADNLLSVRELVDASGIVEASYDYDPYGVRMQLSGTENSDFGFARLFHEAQSGLDLALYRGYNAAHRGWLSRDPMGEIAGPNLYSYALNSPINYIDPRGLWYIAVGFAANLWSEIIDMGTNEGPSGGLVIGTNPCGGWFTSWRSFASHLVPRIGSYGAALGDPISSGGFGGGASVGVQLTGSLITGSLSDFYSKGTSAGVQGDALGKIGFSLNNPGSQTGWNWNGSGTLTVGVGPAAGLQQITQSTTTYGRYWPNNF